MAEGLLALARSVDQDGVHPTSRAMVVKEMRDTLSVLRAAAPEKRERDRLDELSRRRDRRRAAS